MSEPVMTHEKSDDDTRRFTREGPEGCTPDFAQNRLTREGSKGCTLDFAESQHACMMTVKYGQSFAIAYWRYVGLERISSTQRQFATSPDASNGVCASSGTSGGQWQDDIGQRSATWKR